MSFRLLFSIIEYRQYSSHKNKLVEGSRLFGVDYSVLVCDRSLGGNLMIDKNTDGTRLFFLTMNKTKLFTAICLCTLLASCGITRDKTYCVNYQAIRQKYVQPTKEEPIPSDAKIVVAYHLSRKGELTAIVNNRTSEIMIIDQTLSFFVNSDGTSTSYYDPTVRSTSTTNHSSKSKGVSVNLGSVANAFGVGGIVGDLANGINVGGSGTKGKSVTEETYIADLPQVSVAPNSNTAMSKVFTVAAIAKPIEERREIILPLLKFEESPYKFSVCISYSIDGGKTFEKIITEFYAESYINVPLKSEGNVSEALNIIEKNRPDMYNTPWYILHFLNNYQYIYIDEIYNTGIIYDYQ